MSYFFHNIIRRKVSTFGSLFDIFYVRHIDEGGELVSELKLPISYSNKDKLIMMPEIRGDDPTNFRDNIRFTEPRAGFEITNIKYNPEQKLNRLNRFIQYANNQIQNHNQTIGSLENDTVNELSTNIIHNVYSPVSYKIYFNLYLITNRNADYMQLVEQIISKFSPFVIQRVKYNLNDNIFLEFDEATNLESVEKEILNNGDFRELSRTIHTFRFSSDIRFFREEAENRIIKKYQVSFSLAEDNTEKAEIKNFYVAPKDENIVVDMDKFYFYFYDDLYGDQETLDNSQIFEDNG